MRPAYWIGLLALLGAIPGYMVYQASGWLGAGIGAVVGVLVRTQIHRLLTGKPK